MSFLMENLKLDIFVSNSVVIHHVCEMFCECTNVLLYSVLKKGSISTHLPPSILAEMKYFKIVSKLFLSLLKFAMPFCLWVGADSTRPSGHFCHCTVTADLTAFATVL